MRAVERAAAAEAAGPRNQARAGALSDSVPPLIDAWAANDPSAWRHVGPGGSEGVMPVAWLTELAAATRGRWMAVDPPAAGFDDKTWAMLVHASGMRARLSLTNGIVTLCDAAGVRCEQARLEEAAQRSLQRSLQR